MPSIARQMQEYISEETQRMHTPGHKGELPRPLSEAAKYDLTELPLTGDLFAGGPPFDEVECMFSKFYKDGATLLSAGGASLAVQGMLATFCRPGQTVIMLRGCHRSAVSACGFLGLNPMWIAPLPGEEEEAVRQALERGAGAAAVYITSPDYYGYIAPVERLARLCESFGVPLLVDAAQGAHLTFFGLHPVCLGAAAAATSPHKTLPALTGGALLHLRDKQMKDDARAKMALFGSTSPSYLILLSLDMLAGRMAGIALDYRALADYLVRLSSRFENKGLLAEVSPMDPIRVTLDFSGTNLSSEDISEAMKQAGVTPELIWGSLCVLLPAPHSDFLPVEALACALPDASKPKERSGRIHLPAQAVPVRTAMLGASVSMPVREAAGHACASIKTACPPGVPVIVPGEIIDETVIHLLLRAGFESINVLK